MASEGFWSRPRLPFGLSGRCRMCDHVLLRIRIFAACADFCSSQRSRRSLTHMRTGERTRKSVSGKREGCDRGRIYNDLRRKSSSAHVRFRVETNHTQRRSAFLCSIRQVEGLIASDLSETGCVWGARHGLAGTGGCHRFAQHFAQKHWRPGRDRAVWVGLAMQATPES